MSPGWSGGTVPNRRELGGSCKIPKKGSDVFITRIRIWREDDKDAKINQSLSSLSEEASTGPLDGA